MTTLSTDKMMALSLSSLNLEEASLSLSSSSSSSSSLSSSLSSSSSLQDNKFGLTRFLFIKDEVVLSLITALLKKQDLSECYYWIFELYYSGFEVFQLMWKIYFDFYYELSPKMEDYILKKQSLFDNNNNNNNNNDNNDNKMIHIAAIIRNLFRLTPTSNVFMLRHYMEIDICPTIIYKNSSNNTNYKWLCGYPVKYHKLLMSVYNGHVENICYYIKLLLESGEDNVENIRRIIMVFVEPNLTLLGIDKELFEHKWNVRKYKNDLHYLLAFICHLQTPISILNNCNIFVSPKDSDIDFINKVEKEPIPLTKKYGLEQLYNTLGFKRYYNIASTIGSFNLSRWSTSEFNNNNKGYYDYNEFLRKNWFCWEYYAANGCPLWKERLDRFGGKVDNEKQIIYFPDESCKEKFYDLYAYEFDEQPKDIQGMSHCDLIKRTWDEWYFDIFDTKPIVRLNEDFSYSSYF